MKSEITIQAPAKINWLLRVLGRRADGYHDIETIFQAISLYDTLQIRRADTFSFRCSDLSIPLDESNLVVRAHRLLHAPPVAIELTKRIPPAGGLGGGSSDAAATLLGLRGLFDLPVTDTKLNELALELGSDVPFFLEGGVCHGTGRGELLRRLSAPSNIPLLLSLSEDRVSTADAYRWLDREERNRIPLGVARASEIAAAGFLKYGSDLTNDFEPVVFERFPTLASIKDQMVGAGATWCGLSGSGPTLVAAFYDRAGRQAAVKKLSGISTIAAETI